MTRQASTLIYLASRVIAAALNLASVAVFTRLASVETYGAYLLILAWSFIIQGLATRWVSEALLARYRTEELDSYLAASGAILAGVTTLILAILAGAAGLGYLAPVTAVALGVMVTGLSAYDYALQSSRVLLHVRLSAGVAVLRAVLSLTAGVVALTAFEGPSALPLAIGLAHLAAALPALVSYRARLSAGTAVAVCRDLWGYGWLLAVAGGGWALAQNVDRLILTHYHSSDSLGAYGALGDFLKQSFFVFGEVVALSLVSIARRAHADGRADEAREVLAEAMRSVVLIAVMGSIFIYVTRDLLIATLFGPDFRPHAHELLPLLLAANAFLVLRTFYFGQVIFFLNSSFPHLVGAGAQLSVSIAVGLWLVPTHATDGAAIALLAGQATSCVVLAAWRWGSFVLPLPIADAARIIAAGAVVLFGTELVAMAGLPDLATEAIDAVVAGAGAIGMALWFNLFGVRLVVARLRGPAGRSRDGDAAKVPVRFRTDRP